jgi:hypothetical protein
LACSLAEAYSWRKVSIGLAVKEWMGRLHSGSIALGNQAHGSLGTCMHWQVLLSDGQG